MTAETDDVGIGLSAKFIEKGGADLILIYNSGRFRMAGRGSLAGLMPYSDANQVVVEMVRTYTPAQIDQKLTNEGQRSPPRRR